MRTITISCPSCRTEFKKIDIDQAERILFYGCADCREQNKMPLRFQSGRRQQGSGFNIPADEQSSTG